MREHFALISTKRFAEDKVVKTDNVKLLELL